MKEHLFEKRFVRFDVYVSTNAGPWMLWQSGVTNQSAAFSGQFYQRYAFLALARDNVGNLEVKGANPAPDSEIIITDNAPPVLAPLVGQTVLAGRTLSLTASASDADMPAQTLTFSLAPGAPLGASIHPITGQFEWTPGPAAIDATNLITVGVTDDGLPPLSAWQNFTVTVLPEIRLKALRLDDGAFAVEVNAPAGRSYTLQASTNLATWSDLLVTNSAPAPFVFVLTNGPTQFYRVRTP
jgi:hypothetical protein